MKRKNNHIIFLLVAAMCVTQFSCVERIDFEVPPASVQTVVEGMITSDPGPYTVKVSRGINLDALSAKNTPVGGLEITLFDDQGNSEPLVEDSEGVYVTGGVIQGEIGRAYHIRIETPDGQIYESTPDILNPTGQMEAINFEYEARTIEENFGQVPADVFNIFVDGNAGILEESYTRWRFSGTYEVETFPKFRERRIPTYRPFKDPPTCSGYIVVGAIPMGRLEKVADCTCCFCWVNDFEQAPQLSDNLLVSNNEFRNIKVAEVPINPSTFYNKYRVTIEQMSMSRNAFEFFRLIRSQKENASNIFQSTFGEIPGNIQAVNNSDPIVGIFWATSIDTLSRFIQRSDVPYPVTDIEFSTISCLERYENSTIEKPDGWD